MYYNCITVSQGSDITKVLFVLEFNLHVIHFTLDDFTLKKKLLLFFKLKSFNIGKLIWRIPFVSSIIRRKMSPFEVTCFYLLLIFYFLLLYFFIHMYVHGKQSYLLTKWIAELCLLVIFKLTMNKVSANDSY